MDAVNLHGATTYLRARSAIDPPHVAWNAPPMPRRRRWGFTLRALLALAMLVGYYVVAFGVTLLSGLTLLGMVWARNTQGVAYLLPVATFIVSGWMGVKVLFERDPSDSNELPGVPLTRAEAPALFALVEEVALALGARAPDAIRLVSGAEMGVAERRRKRTLVMGYLALDALDLAGLRSVVAHELGHTLAGDDALAPLVYRSHRALRRSFEILSRERIAAGLWPFQVAHDLVAWVLKGYTRLALRVSRAVARKQELEADRHAVMVAGKATFLSALERLVHRGVAVDLFHESEIVAMALVVDRGGVFHHRFASRLAVTVGEQVIDPWVLAREAGSTREGLARLHAVLRAEAA